MKKIESLNILRKRIFLRADIDVPIKRQGVRDKEQEFEITDTQKLENLIPTIRFLLSQNCRILLAGHIGRPANNRDFSLSTKPLVTILSKLLDINIVHFSNFEEAALFKRTLGLLENLRFWEGEEKNDENFTRQLARLADVYINEAFAACHRQHASIVGVPKFLPHAAGFRLRKEVEILTKVLKQPKRPQIVIIGGVKLETKLPVIENLAKTANFVLVGGLIAVEAAKQKLQLPSNVILANLTKNGKDMSDESILEFCEKIKTAAQIVWNGPPGLFEEVENEKGTREITEAISNSIAEKIVGGGETIVALKKFGLLAKMDWVSSGGGAMLEFLVKGTLPGIESLR